MSYSFTNRTGGVSTGAFASLNFGLHVGDDPSQVLTNRKILTERVGPVQFMSQEHGNKIALIQGVIDSDPVADSLVTGIPGINLAVQVAAIDHGWHAWHRDRSGAVRGNRGLRRRLRPDTGDGAQGRDSAHHRQNAAGQEGWTGGGALHLRVVTG